MFLFLFFFFSSRRRHTRFKCDWSSDVCSSDLAMAQVLALEHPQRLASVVIAASWTKADAYFRRLFALRREILARLGPATYLQAGTPLHPPSLLSLPNNERSRRADAPVPPPLSPQGV